MKLRFFRLATSFALTLAVMLTACGCSNMPTKPEGMGQSQAPLAASGAEQVQPIGLPLLNGGGNVTTRTVMVGLLGGIVSVGDFTLVIPPAALPQPAAVTVRQADLDHPVVDLTISPASANHFRLPVLLVANARKMDPSLLSIAQISWWNPATQKWEAVSGSSVSVGSLTVTAPLQHFSTYRVSGNGKAGW